MLPKCQSQKCPQDCFAGGNERGRLPSSSWGLPDKPPLLRRFHPLAGTEGNRCAAAELTVGQKATAGEGERSGDLLWL